MSANQSYPSAPAKASKPSGIDLELHKLLKDRIHPYRWAVGLPWYGAKSTAILARMIGASPKDGGARKLTPYQLMVCRQLQKRLYVVSGDQGYGVFTADADAHRPDQTLAEAQQAIEIIVAEWERLIQTLLPSWCYPSSHRGWHGSAWIDYRGYDPADVCQTFDHVEAGLKRLLYWRGSSIWQTIEVKGHPAYLKADGSLYCGQLTRIPVEMPWWDWGAFQIVQGVTPIPLKLFKDFAFALQTFYPPTPSQHPNVGMPGYGGQSQPILTVPPSASVPPPGLASPPQAVLPTPSTPPNPSATQAPSVTQNSPPMPHVLPSPQQNQPHGCCYVSDLRSEPNSFKRQLEALRRYARHLKRVPTPTEAVDFVRAEILFTGDWNTNLSRREQRIAGILNEISSTFDSTKVTGKAKPLDLQGVLQHMRAYIQNHFPNGTTYDPESPATVGSRLSPEHLAVFLCITEFCLARDPNPDESVPRVRFERLWRNMVPELTEAVWNRHHWRRLREFFVLQGLIVITDRETAPKKAMRWKLGANFPVSSNSRNQQVP